MEKDNKYYVYGHYYRESNEIFYIGKGTRDRATTIANRSKNWKLAVENKSWYSVILFSGMSNFTALEKEEELIKLLSDKIINNKVRKKNRTSVQVLREYLKYDETSPTGLTWLKRVGPVGPSTSRNVGDSAGYFKYYKGKKTSVILNFKGRDTKAHHIVWALVHGEYLDPNLIIDHIDGNPHNNLVDNLRITSSEVNSKNRAKQINNRTGITGVWRQCIQGRPYTVASVHIDQKQVQKFFNENKLGKDQSLQLACIWREEQIRLLNEQGAGYTERHGT